MKIVNALSRILETLTVIMFSTLIIVVLIQITGRYSPFTFVWTEELTRYLFIYSIAFGAPIAMERKEYISVDLLIGFLPKKAKKYYEALIYLVLGAFSAFLVSYSYEFAILGKTQTSATLEVDMFYIYLSMVVTFVFLAFYSFANIIYLFTRKEDEEEGVEV